ncbi:hypothetical protein EV363DRAFT_40927 [Boletus edulis]|nr:hypothetical protein EV363DRAFT_40927 [Boletus edulis]
MSLVLLVRRFWPLLQASLFHGWESKGVVGLDDLCSQVEALTSSTKRSFVAKPRPRVRFNRVQVQAQSVRIFWWCSRDRLIDLDPMFYAMSGATQAIHALLEDI